MGNLLTDTVCKRLVKVDGHSFKNFEFREGNIRGEELKVQNRKYVLDIAFVYKVFHRISTELRFVHTGQYFKLLSYSGFCLMIDAENVVNNRGSVDGGKI